MKKNIVQDVVPKKSIRNIKLSPKKELTREIKRPQPRQPVVEEEETTDFDEFARAVPLQVPMRIEPIAPKETTPKVESNSYKYEYNDNKKSSKKWVYISGLVLILAIAFGVSAMFKSASIKITPKQDSEEINNTFVAKKDAITGLGFQTVTVTKDIEKTVKATGEEKVERKSQGKIIIYNNFNNQPQKLVATTRFQTPEGLIYRLINPVSIPGREVKDGKTVPGSIEVTVEADKPGVSYNIGLKDFTIPGLKGDPKYTAIYARSKTDMSGGFSGLQKTVSKDVLAQTETEMTASLKEALSKDIEAQIPANFISYNDALSYELDAITQVEAASKEEVVLRKKGNATSIIFDKGILTKSILSAVMPEVQSESVKIANLNNLVFVRSGATTDGDKQVSFTLSGTANFVWIFDQNTLKNDLLGLSKKSAMTVISKYPSINEAWIETKPFWNQKIPNDSEKVTLINTAESI